MEERFCLRVEESDSVENVLKKQLHLTRHQISRLKFTEDGIWVNGKAARATSSVSCGDEISIRLYDMDPDSSACPWPILYEDRWVIVINKPAGDVVHPSPGHETDSIQTILEAYCGMPLHICGRLDKDTSGCLLFSKVDWLVNMLHPHKTYHAWVRGKICPCTIEAPLAMADRKMVVDSAGKFARTRIVKAENFGDRSFITVEIDTGRMHQIRCHLACLGHPLIGDPVYSDDDGRALLHCEKLSFSLPSGRVHVHAPLPEDMTYNQKDKGDL